MRLKSRHNILIFLLLGLFARGQDVAYNDTNEAYEKAHELAYNGNHGQAQSLAIEILKKDGQNKKARSLVARTYSWAGQFDKARREFNTLTSETKEDRDLWILAVKNELYAKNNATALGLANKALRYVEHDTELMRLAEMAQNRIENQTFPEKSWIANSGTILKKQNSTSSRKNKQTVTAAKDSPAKAGKGDEVETADEKAKDEKVVLNNRIAVRNSFTVFDQRFDPMVFSTVEFRRRTLAGSLLPRINYSNRNGEHGVQYDIDFYPKFSKRFYAYLNYGYSDATIYPNHKVGGDLYVNLPGAMEFSAGGRFVSLDTRDITMITNSVGHYRGNYYFSLRTNIIPKEDNLVQFSGNLLIRKYLKDAETFLSLNMGMGYSPELRQLISGDELLAETLLYIESQRVSLQYQFTAKKSPNVYSASIGVTRQELAFKSGSFVWAVSAGLAYQVGF